MKTFVIYLAVAVLVCFGVLAQQPKTAEGAAQAAPKKNPSEFTFDGGNMWGFLNAINESFNLDVLKIGTIPEKMYRVKVPKMRLRLENEQKVVLVHVLTLYNQISKEGDSSMGRWVFKGGQANDPDVLMLVAPSESTNENSISIKAFAMPLPQKDDDKKLKAIHEMIQIEQNRILALGGKFWGTAADIEGEIRYHPEAGIIVATGGKTYVNLATAIIEAVKNSGQLADIPIPSKEEK